MSLLYSWLHSFLSTICNNSDYKDFVDYDKDIKQSLKKHSKNSLYMGNEIYT